MKREVIIGVIVLLVVIALILITGNMTGNVVNSKSCIDSDRGIKEFVFGNVTATDVYGKTSYYEDACLTDKSLEEKYCNSDSAPVSTNVNCNGTCENGACSLNCSENWNCGSWSTCYASEQVRICTDLNSCNTTINKPVEAQTCIVTNETITTNTSTINQPETNPNELPNLPEEPIPEPTINECSWWCKFWKSILG